jgi:radical SAM superfamily enzyme YgiQ (UPF0313 family)
MGNKKVTLFNSPLIGEKIDKAEEGNEIPRIGIASLAAYLLDRGVSVNIIDSRDTEIIGVRLMENSPDIVGIPAYTSEIHDSAYTAKIVRKLLPEATLVVGGPHPSAMPMETLEEFDVFDIAVAGEGEQTMMELSLNNSLESIKGIAYRAKDGAINVNEPRPVISNLDDIAFPAWHLYDMGKFRVSEDQREGILDFGYKKRRMAIQVEAARGCPFDCIFCFRIAGRLLRYRSPEMVVDEIEKNADRYGPVKIYFIEGTFGIDKEKTVQLCDAIIKRGLNRKIIWEASSRVDVVDKHVLLKMRESGCRNLGFGIESGDPEILRKIGKNTDPKKIVDAIELCNEVGIQVGTTFILGHPYETHDSIVRTIKFARKLPVATANFAIMVPFPGTKVREMAQGNIGGLKIRSNNWRYYGKQVGYSMELEQIPHEKLLAYQNRAYMEFYLRPRRLKYLLHHLTWDRAKFAAKRIVGTS